jgi:hypothetical protein
MTTRVRALVLCAALMAPLTLSADEGFWLINRPPRAAIEAAYGVDVSDAWLQRVQRSSVRSRGGSGVFVSPRGLVLTNHHVALEVLRALSTPGRDYVKHGLLARSTAAELRAPNLEIAVLDRIDDVTTRVNAAVTPTMSAAEQHPDNFRYPRDALDMAVFRVYERGQPLAVAQYLPWSRTGAQEGDAVFTSGHPGSTQRLNTLAHLEALRDSSLPINLEMNERLHDAVAAYRRLGDEHARRAGELFFGLENTLKSLRGELAGLRDPALLERKRHTETALRAAVSRDADYRGRFGDAWDNVARARRELTGYNLERLMFEAGHAFLSDYFQYARMIVRWADQSTKPNAERLPEYIEPRRFQIERQLGSAVPVYLGLEKVRLTTGLTLMREKLGEAHPLVVRVLAGRTPAARAAHLIERSKVGDPAYRLQLFAGGAAKVSASTDPMIDLVAQAVFATAGESAYPDANFTLRLSYGSITGYQEDGAWMAPFTELRGLYARADQHGHKMPYELPARWLTAREQLALTTPFNFVTTNDIVGGNSGSPVINACGEIVGLIFDGNLQSLAGHFVYDGRANRAIAVDTRGMIEALRKVYAAGALAGELLGQ